MTWEPEDLTGWLWLILVTGWVAAILFLTPGCLDKTDPHRFQDACLAKGGTVVITGEIPCEEVSVCQHDPINNASVCRNRQECGEAPWRCELPAEVKAP